MDERPAILAFGSARALVPAEHVNHLMFELLLLDMSTAESATCENLCARIRDFTNTHTGSDADAIPIHRDDAALLLRAVSAMERKRLAPRPLLKLRRYATRMVYHH